MMHLRPSSIAALLSPAAALLSTSLHAAEPEGAGAPRASSSSEAQVDMSAPGRSTVPAPAFSPAPRLQRRNDFSPQNMAVELRFGPYTPRVDENTDTEDFRNFFGDKKRYQFGFEVDGQLWRAPYLGTLGVGVGWSYTRLSGANKAPSTVVLDTPIEQKSTLNIMPMYAVGVLRLDVLAHDFGIPLVGYGKFGLGYALWWINNGNGTARADCVDAASAACKPGLVGRDISIGTQAALGAMFLLDVLEPSAGAELDASSGVNNSYVFIEWSVSNFGGDQMNVGTNTWVAGLAIEL